MNDPLLKKSNSQSVGLMLLLCAVCFIVLNLNQKQQKTESIVNKNTVYSLTLLSCEPQSKAQSSTPILPLESKIKPKDIQNADSVVNRPSETKKDHKTAKIQSKVWSSKKKVKNRSLKSDVGHGDESRVNDTKSIAESPTQNNTKSAPMEQDTKLSNEVALDKVNAVTALLAFLKSKRKYPKNARRHNIEGECVLRVSINSTGIVEKSILEKESSYSVLNNECKRLSSIVTGFNAKAKSSMSVIVPVRFVLNE